MSITRIQVSNFKSFEKLDIKLGNFNVLIGANASGKSNFVQIFQFLKNIILEGLDNAISMEGGAEYIRNINLDSKQLHLKIETDYQSVFETNDWIFAVNNTNYDFKISFDYSGIEIVNESFMQIGEFKRKVNGISNTFKDVFVKIVRDKDGLNLRKSPEIDVKDEEFSIVKILKNPGFEKKLLIEMPMILPMNFIFFIRMLKIYNIDTSNAKNTSPIKRKTELEEDGSNIANIIKDILDNEEAKRKLFNLLQDVLDFAKDLKIEKFMDKSLLFKLHENFNNSQYIPSSMLSDGTINIITLIIALYFDVKIPVNHLRIFDEPEKSIHPALIPKIVAMMIEVSKQNQIIITTHNPEIVKHAGIENLLLVSRNSDGFSTITKPEEKKHLRTFLDNEIGIDELYIDNLLEN